VTGYPGSNDLTMAMERGEIDARCGWTWSAMKATRSDWIAEKKVFIALQFSPVKHPDLPDVPVVTDLARNDTERQALDLILVNSTMGRPYAAPPKVPAERVQALRRAFDATMKDPGFLADSEKQDLEVLPMSGEDLQALVANMFKASPQAIEAARNAINPPGATPEKK
jgi:tripartite-type tricarboxylate transporter receptor subunit TctC